MSTKTIYTQTVVNCQSFLPGLGKTQMSLNKITDKFLNKEANKIIYSAPTNMLLEQVYDDLIKRGINKDDIIFISSSNDSKKPILKQIRQNNITSKNRVIILITHTSYLNFYEYFKDYDIKIFDEEMSECFEIYNIYMKIPGEREIFDNIIDYEINDKNPKIAQLKLKNNNFKIDPKSLSYKSMNYYFYQYLKNDVFDLYAISETLIDFYDKKRDDIVFFKIAKPKVFQSKQETIYLGYDIHNSMTSIISSIVNDIKFIEDTTNYKNLIRKDYSNNFNIKYFYEGIFGNSYIRYTSQQYILDIQDVIKNKNLMKDALYVWQYDMSDNFRNYLKKNNAIEIPAKPHGMNEPEWMNRDRVVITANYKTTPLEQMICSALSIEIEKFIEARHVNMIIQIMARCKLRKMDNIDIDVVVCDQDTAERIKSRLDNGSNKINLEYLGLKKLNLKTVSFKKDNTTKILSPEEELKKQKSSIYFKLTRLKSKDFLTEKQKLKLLSLQQQYDALLVRKKRKP